MVCHRGMKYDVTTEKNKLSIIFLGLALCILCSSFLIYLSGDFKHCELRLTSCNRLEKKYICIHCYHLSSISFALKFIRFIIFGI